MSTPATSLNWVINFRKLSQVDQTTYSITIPAITVSKQVPTDIAASLKTLGYVNISWSLVVVLP